MRELSKLLWDERQLLDLLLFKLEEESLVLSSGRHAWLARATSEVEFVLERISEMETQREAEASIVAADLGLEGVPTLERIAAAAPEPWATTMRDHRRAFKGMISRTQDVAQRNKQLLAKYVVAVSNALQVVGSATGLPRDSSYAPDGSVTLSPSNLHLVDAHG